MTATAAMFALRDATIIARKATGDQHISTQAKAGAVQIVRAVPVSGRAHDITPLSGWLPIHDAVMYLRNMQAAQ